MVINDRIDLVRKEDVIKLSADCHYNPVNIHLFDDGIRRTTRLLMKYFQLYHGGELIKILTEEQEEYIEALNETEESGNTDILRDFICSRQIKFFEKESDKYHKRKSGFSLLF